MMERISGTESVVKKRELNKLTYYLTIFLGFVTFVFGFISIVVYLGILYLSPVISNLTGIVFLTSRYFLLTLIMLTFAGFFTDSYPVSKAIDGNSSFHVIMAFGCSGVALGTQVFKLAISGPTWIGLDLLGSSGNTMEMMYLTAVYFVYSLILFVVEFTLLKGEFSE